MKTEKQRKEKTVKLHLERLYELSEDHHNIHTPFDLCEKMLEKIPELNSRMKILVMFNLEFIYKLREKFGKENMENVWFMTPCKKKAIAAESFGINKNNIRFYSYNNKEIKEIETMPKFDVVVGNPPYNAPKSRDNKSRSKLLYPSFVDLSYKISKYSSLLIPFRWAKIESLKKFRKKMFNNLNIKYIKILDPDKIWNHQVALASYVCYYISDKNYKGNIIDVEETNGEIVKFDPKENDIYINDLIINEILFKIDFKDNMSLHYQRPQFIHTNGKIKLTGVNDKVKNEKFSGSFPVIASKNRIFYVNPTLLENYLYRYHLNKCKLIVPVVYGPWTKGFSTSMKTFGKNYFTTQSNIFFPFDTEEEAENCKNYLNTKFVVFLKNIIQVDRAFSPSIFKYIPYMNFSKLWDDKKLYKHFNLTNEEINYIESQIILR